MGKGNWAEAAVLDWLLGGSTPTRPSTRAIALHSADPGDTGASELANTGAYARVAATFNAASTPAGTATNSGAVTFTQASADWNSGSTIGYFGIWDSATYAGGNFLYGGSITVPKSVLNGDTASFASAAITVTET